MPRSLDNWQPWYDDQGSPFYGRMTFYKLHTTDLEEIYNYDATLALDNPILTSQYGITSQQVFLADRDYTIVMEKYIGPGPMVVDDPDTSHWMQIRTFDNLAPEQHSTSQGGEIVNVITAGTTMGALYHTDGNPDDNLYAIVLGYYNLGDMPPQYYKLVRNVDPNFVDDGGSMIRPSGSTSTVWKLVPQENIDCRVFGVFPTEAISIENAYSSQLRNCFSYADSIGKDVYMPSVFESMSYYWLDGGTYQLGQKVHIDAGTRIIGKPLTISAFTVDEIECFGTDLFISAGDYGTISVNCPVVYSRWISPNLATWSGTIRKMILDGYTLNHSTPLRVRNCEVEILKDLSGKTIEFENCTITGNGKLTSCDVKFIRCGYISDKLVRASTTVSELTGNYLRVENFSNANKYIEWKNIQGEHDYGSLGEQHINAQVYADGLVEDGYGVINIVSGSTGTLEIHNFSGDISGDLTNVKLNIVDSWVRLLNLSATNTVDQIDLRRGSISCAYDVNLTNNSTFDLCDINAHIVTPTSKATFNRCNILSNVTTFDVDISNSKISGRVTTYPDPNTGYITFKIDSCTFVGTGNHYLTSAGVNATIRNGQWLNNIGNGTALPIQYDLNHVANNDLAHAYKYENNTGNFLPKYPKHTWFSGNFMAYPTIARWYADSPCLCLPGLGLATSHIILTDGIWVPEDWTGIDMPFFSIGDVSFSVWKMTVAVTFKNTTRFDHESSNTTDCVYTYSGEISPVSGINNASSFKTTVFNGTIIGQSGMIPFNYTSPVEFEHPGQTSTDTCVITFERVR